MVVKGIQKMLIKCTRRLLDLQSLPDEDPKTAQAADTKTDTARAVTGNQAVTEGADQPVLPECERGGD